MQKRLFDIPPEPKPPRATPRKLMHVIDAGAGCSAETGELDNVKFGCRRCGYESDWQLHTMTAAKRGIPCPVCSRDRKHDCPAAGCQARIALRYAMCGKHWRQLSADWKRRVWESLDANGARTAEHVRLILDAAKSLDGAA